MDKLPAMAPQSQAQGSAKSLTISNRFTAERFLSLSRDPCRIMAMIDEEKLTALEREFSAHPSGLTRDQFIS